MNSGTLTVSIPQKRNRYKDKPHSDRVALIVAKHYDELRDRFCKGHYGNFDSMSFADIFQETIPYVIQDKTAFDLPELELIEHFGYRYKMIEYQIIQDSRMIHYTDASNIHAPE